MGLLILLLLCPIVFGQSYQKNNDPNDEPFLPIFPIYPYNPKLIKRGIDKETETQLTAELYAPKVDAKDSYTPNYSTNYQKDPYYPNYDPYTKAFPSSSTSYSPYYSNNPQATTTPSYSTLPYNIYNTYTNPYVSTTSHSSIPSTAYSPSSYSTTAYPSPYSSNSYTGAPYQPPPYVPVSNYYYQQPYYYPSYYAPALFPPPPPPPPYPHPDYSKESDSDGKESYEKDSRKSQKNKKDNKNQDTSDDRSMNDGNYISSNSNDLDSQSSSYKVANSYNQLEQTNEPHEKSSGSGIYKVINIRTQPSDTEYSIAATYAKTQQLEQLMRQTLAKLLAENAARQIIRYPTYDNKQNHLIKDNEVSYGNINNYDNNNAQNFVSGTNTIAKTGLNFVINPNTLGNLNSGSIVPRQVLETPSTLTRSAKFPDDQYLRKPITLMSLQQSQGTYIPPNKSIKSSVSTQSSNYNDYENEGTRINQNYDSTLDNTERKQEEGYSQSQQTATAYKTQNFVTVQTPQAYSYQYASYHPEQTTNQQGIQEYDDNTSDVEFGAKQSNKG